MQQKRQFFVEKGLKASIYNKVKAREKGEIPQMW
jgi:hypothetical protein